MSFVVQTHGFTRNEKKVIASLKTLCSACIIGLAKCARSQEACGVCPHVSPGYLASGAFLLYPLSRYIPACTTPLDYFIVFACVCANLSRRTTWPIIFDERQTVSNLGTIFQCCKHPHDTKQKMAKIWRTGKRFT